MYEVVRLDASGGGLVPAGAKFADKVIHKEVFKKKKSSREKVGGDKYQKCGLLQHFQFVFHPFLVFGKWRSFREIIDSWLTCQHLAMW